MEQMLERLLAKMDATQHKMDVNKREFMAKRDATANAWLDNTEAFLEKKEPTPEETEAIVEPQEVLDGATEEETIGAAKDQSRDWHLAVGCRGQLKMRTKRNGGFRQEYAATFGWPTCRTVPAARKGKLRRGPGKKFCSGIRG
jgi:hypothetical protein